MSTFRTASTRAAARTLPILVSAALVAAGCGGSSMAQELDIQSVNVPGPPEGWDMASRMMNRQSASSATLAAADGSGPTAAFEAISASLYYDPDGMLPLTGTVTLRADSLSSDDNELQGQLESWLQPSTYPAFIFQTTTARLAGDAIETEGNLLLRDTAYPAASRWEVTTPVAINDEGRRVGELRATVTATVPGSPFANDELRVVMTLPAVGYTADFVRGVLDTKGIDAADITGTSPDYPSGASDLSDVAWYLMLSGDAPKALEVFQMSLDKAPQVNTYMRMADGYIFDSQYGMAVGIYQALEEYNLGHAHSLELIKLLSGQPLDTAKLATIQTAWAGS